MNARTLIIRFGIGTLVAAVSALASASEPVVDLAAAEIVEAPRSPVSAAINNHHEQSMLENGQISRGEAERARGELQLAEELTRQLDAQLERRLASRLEQII